MAGIARIMSNGRFRGNMVGRFLELAIGFARIGRLIKRYAWQGYLFGEEVDQLKRLAEVLVMRYDTFKGELQERLDILADAKQRLPTLETLRSFDLETATEVWRERLRAIQRLHASEVELFGSYPDVYDRTVYHAFLQEERAHPMPDDWDIPPYLNALYAVIEDVAILTMQFHAGVEQTKRRIEVALRRVRSTPEVVKRRYELEMLRMSVEQRLLDSRVEERAARLRVTMPPPATAHRHMMSEAGGPAVRGGISRPRGIISRLGRRNRERTL